MDSTGNYSAGETARRSGFSLDTLRYYERLGLLSRVARDHAGRRRYSDLDLGWLSLIRCLRTTGMAIADIKRFVDLCAAGPGTQDQRLFMLQDHDRQIDDRIVQMRGDQAYLKTKIETYRLGQARPPSN